jgi:hypothetical protein
MCARHWGGFELSSVWERGRDDAAERYFGAGFDGWIDVTAGGQGGNRPIPAVEDDVLRGSQPVECSIKLYDGTRQLVS